MNQEQLINQTSSNSGIQDTTVARCLDAMVTVIEDTLADGECISIRRFGSFRVSQHKERNNVNPRTLEPIITPANKHVKFNAGSQLLDKVRKK